MKSIFATMELFMKNFVYKNPALLRLFVLSSTSPFALIPFIMLAIWIFLMSSLTACCAGWKFDYPVWGQPTDLDLLTNTPCKYGYGPNEEWKVTYDPSKKYMLVNGVWPPPTIEVKVGERIRITLTNNLGVDEPITPHFHGKFATSCDQGGTGLTNSQAFYRKMATM